MPRCAPLHILLEERMPEHSLRAKACFSLPLRGIVVFQKGRQPVLHNDVVFQKELRPVLHNDDGFRRGYGLSCMTTLCSRRG